MSSKVKFHVRKKRVKSSPIRTTKEQRKKQKAAKRKKKRLLSQQTQNKQRTTTKRLKLILRPNSNVSNHNHHPQRNNNSRVAVRSRSSQFDLDPDSENENMASANTPSALEKALAEAAKYKRLYHAEAQKVAAKNMDIYKLINEGALDSVHQGVDKAISILCHKIHLNRGLFTLELQQWIRIVTQLQGVYDIMIIDMRQRLSLQKYPEDRPIPKAALSSNDCCETSNGGAQHYQGKGPNMRDSTRAGHVCSDMNDPWYTIDHMIQYTRKDFEPFLKEWHQECGTYEEAIKESKQTKSTHETAKARNIHWKLNSSSQEVPARQRNIRLDKPRQIISVSLPLLNDTVWMEWIDERDKILSRYSGLGINMTKRQLKAELVRRLTANNISYTQRTGLDSMQRSLYNVCRMRIE
eukprot:50613_1